MKILCIHFKHIYFYTSIKLLIKMVNRYFNQNRYYSFSPWKHIIKKSPRKCLCSSKSLLLFGVLKHPCVHGLAGWVDGSFLRVTGDGGSGVLTCYCLIMEYPHYYNGVLGLYLCLAPRGCWLLATAATRGMVRHRTETLGSYLFISGCRIGFYVDKPKTSAK